MAYILLTLLALLAVLPCLHVVSKGISAGAQVTAGKVYFWPVGVQFETVDYVLNKTSFFTSLRNSLIVTSLGTLLSMFTTITTAYPLSKPSFRGRKTHHVPVCFQHGVLRRDHSGLYGCANARTDRYLFCMYPALRDRSVQYVHYEELFRRPAGKRRRIGQESTARVT